jgi:uncharacterized protein YbjT (DUF2867 family)
MMRRTILITAATGQVSSALLEALDGTDHRLRALVRDPSQPRSLGARGVELHRGDLGDPLSLTAAFEGVSDLWLLTPNGPRAPEHSMNALWAARQAGVQRVVRMSAVGAAHDAPTRSGRLHALSDHELRQSGMAWTILQPHWFMQNLLGAANQVAKAGAFQLNMGSGRLGMVDVRDIATLAAHVLTDHPDRHHGRIYTLTGPQTISFADVADQLAQATGNDITYIPVTDQTARTSMLQAGMPAWIVGMLLEYAQAYASGWGEFTTTDFHDVTGHPSRSFADFARDHADAFTPLV